MPYIYHGFTSLKSDSADATLVRPSNWNARLQYSNFAATGPAGTDAIVREILTGARTYYVRTDGSDSNDGLTNTAGGAFLTIQKACDVAQYSIDRAGYIITIQVADGTYTAGASISGNAPGADGANGYIWIKGNASTPANVLINGPAPGGFSDNFVITNAAVVSIHDVKITNSTGDGFHASQNGLLYYSNIVFGSVLANQVDADYNAIILQGGVYSIVGGAETHLSATYHGKIVLSADTITVTGTPAFSNAFAFSEHGAIVNAQAQPTFSGGATGVRYNCQQLGIIDTGGAGATYFPGDAAGSGTNPGASPYGLYI